MDISKLIYKSIPTFLFFVMALVALFYIFSPAIEYQETVMPDIGKSETMINYSNGFSLPVFKGRYKAWTTYPEYNIGMCILCVIGFAGGLISAYQLIDEYQETKEYEEEPA